MKGRGGADGSGMRGRGGDSGFGPRGGGRGGRGDFHQRDRFNNNFNRSFGEQRSDGSQSKPPSLFDVDQQQFRSFDRGNNYGGGRGQVPFPRDSGGNGRRSSGGEQFHPSGSKPDASDGPPPLLDFGNEKPSLPSNPSSNSLPSLLSVQVESTGKFSTCFSIVVLL